MVDHSALARRQMLARPPTGSLTVPTVRYFRLGFPDRDQKREKNSEVGRAVHGVSSLNKAHMANDFDEGIAECSVIIRLGVDGENAVAEFSVFETFTLID